MHRTTMTTPIGELTLVATDDALREVHLPGTYPGSTATSAEAAPPERSSNDGPVLAQARRELEEYFAGERQDFDVALDPVGTPFQLAAWTALRSIPFGATVSYGEQARRLGDARKARAVGAANGRNPLPIVVPCHRVVGSNGHLTGFGGGLECKAWLLDHERAVLATS